MKRLLSLTSRNALIAGCTGNRAGVVSKLYIRFEGGQYLYARVPLLLQILSYFVVFCVVVCFIFNLTTTKWRFISLPDGLNIPARDDDADAGAAGLDYIFLAPNVHGAFLCWQDHDRSVLVPTDIVLQ